MHEASGTAWRMMDGEDMTTSNDMGIKVISGSVAEYVSGKPNGEIGLIQRSEIDINEAGDALKPIAGKLVLCNADADVHALINLIPLGAKHIDKVQLSIPDNGKVYVLDASKHGISAWAATQAFKISESSRVIVILNNA